MAAMRALLEDQAGEPNRLEKILIYVVAMNRPWLDGTESKSVPKMEAHLNGSCLPRSALELKVALCEDNEEEPPWKVIQLLLESNRCLSLFYEPG